MAPVPLPPPDPGLPEASELLDAAVMRPRLAAAPGAPPGRLGEVRVRYLDYRPGQRLRVLYDAAPQAPGGGGERLAATAFAAAGEATQLRWLPDDPALPLLAHADVRGATRLAYVPSVRVVLRVGERVWKAFADPAELAAAAAGLRAAQVRGLPGPRLLELRPELGALAQTLAPGRPAARADALDLAPAAGRLLAGLAAGPPDGLARLDLLGPLDAPAELVCFAAPELAERVRRARRRVLAGAAEALAAPLVPSHGDFNLGQLLVQADSAAGAELSVVDLDSLGLAPAAFDLASYAANLVSGRPGDLDRAAAALRRLGAAYGAAPPGLAWCLAAVLLRRLDRPLRRLKKRWPERVAASLGALEQTLA